jgi:hypothetical protein
MKAMGANIEGVKKKLSTWAKAKGLEHAMACQVGGDGSYPSMYGLADALVLSKVKQALGLDACVFALHLLHPRRRLPSSSSPSSLPSSSSECEVLCCVAIGTGASLALQVQRRS